MDKTKPSRALRIGLYCLLVLVVGFACLLLAVFNLPLLDPDPAGEGSFQEADAITRQFREFYRTRDASLLPQGHFRLEGLGENDVDGTWMIYYATASHGWIRGGTIVLLGSDGRIDTYFGHHCSSRDGGSMMLPGLDGPFYEGGEEGVRVRFAKAFKHQKTEQAGGGNSAELHASP